MIADSAPQSWRYHVATPGPVAFAICYSLESCARAMLITIPPLLALSLLGNARDVSMIYAAAGVVGLIFGLFVPVLARGLQSGRFYALGSALLVLVPVGLATGTVAGIAVAIVLTYCAQACLLNGINLLMMTHVARRELVRAESLKFFGGATGWLICPALGVYLFEHAAPYWAFGLSAAASLLHILYVGWLGLLRPSGVPVPIPEAALRPWRSFGRFMAQPRLRLSWALNVGRGAWWSSFFVYAPIYVVTMGATGTTGAMVVSVGTGLLYVIPLFGRLAMHMGVRPVIIASFIVAGLATAAVALAGPHVEIGIAFLLIGALAGVALDATTQITFYRAARKRERPEMGMVYGYYRDAASLLPHTLFALLLSFFGLDSVFLAIGLGMFVCAWLGRYVPRSM